MWEQNTGGLTLAGLPASPMPLSHPEEFIIASGSTPSAPDLGTLDFSRHLPPYISLRSFILFSFPLAICLFFLQRILYHTFLVVLLFSIRVYCESWDITFYHSFFCFPSSTALQPLFWFVHSLFRTLPWVYSSNNIRENKVAYSWTLCPQSFFPLIGEWHFDWALSP